uniref:NADH dehydrogenase subunit 5 n=1 Tax=Chorisoserrata biceps TaxID=3037039 RepID=UPI00279C51F1|nr:NADH dehydrogenase subunit 5 [Chorisoserrata biceps]WGO57191.1 NADH dehydrogenase subunit 5 [Chorisoserrata biceps]
MKYVGLCMLNFMFLFIFSLIMLFLGIYFSLNDLIYFIDWEIISLNSTSIVMTFLFDWMSLIFMGFVFFISSLVILYSDYYMSGDYNINRFIYLVLLFVLSMMFMIISPNIISILLGWDGLGLISYCLVIYYQNIKSYNAGMLTALSNRVGDVSLLMSIAWMLNFGSWNYIFYVDCCKDDYCMIIISYLIVLAAITSSAQIPFSSWLPAAMAAPTPVSALVHSSTLVTAGVYLLIRFGVALNESLSSFLLLISGLTMFMSGLGANYEYDLKSIIALSTLSQLGLMMCILSMGYLSLAFFHLLMHALFKALLFMCAGVIIHFVGDSQDIRSMGGLCTHMPFISSCLMVSNFSLCGMPFLAGFYSKDLILEMVSMSNINMFIYFLFFMSTGLTACYSIRLLYYVLYGDFNLLSLFYISENSSKMIISIFILLIFVIFGGSLMSWIFFTTPDLINLPLFLKLLTLLVTFIGGYLGYELSKINLGDILININIVNYFVGSMWFMPYIFTYGLSSFPLLLGYTSMKFTDFGWNEFFGGRGLYLYFVHLSKINQLIQFNNLSMFLLFFIMLFIVVFYLN